ncbi:MAG: FAD:protein FMN transferase [Verrucomicrobiota bacterium]
MVFVVQPRKFEPGKTVLVALVLIVLFVATVTREQVGPSSLAFHGETMGTTYTVKITGSTLTVNRIRELEASIREKLGDLNRQMSNWLPDSEIDKVNRAASSTPVEVSADFMHVLRLAREIGERTGGAFDVTLKPLVDLWGFGPEEGEREAPDEAALRALKDRMGIRWIETPTDSSILKRNPAVQLDLNAIAKGHAVDVVADLVQSNGLKNLYVEIGGEIVAHGTAKSNQVWRIGIERPERGALPGSQLAGIVEVDDYALATSGDYRNYFQAEDGTTFTHILDPRTLSPARHQLAAVTVAAETCALADGMATALFVMGEKEGFGFAEQAKDFEALFVIRQPDGSMSNRWTTGFREKTGFEAVD